MRLLKHDARRAPRRAGFDIRSVHVGFVVDKVAVGQVFLQVRWFFPCQHHSISAPYLFLADDILSWQLTASLNK